jgi:hypothetical protein
MPPQVSYTVKTANSHTEGAHFLHLHINRVGTAAAECFATSFGTEAGSATERPIEVNNGRAQQK